MLELIQVPAEDIERARVEWVKQFIGLPKGEITVLSPDEAEFIKERPIDLSRLRGERR